MSDLIPIRLVPVEVFGAGLCGDDCPHCPTHVGYGLMDAAEPGSDCNRAVGHIYRVDDTDPAYRLPGETMVVYVDVTSLSWFKERRDSGDN